MVPYLSEKSTYSGLQLATGCLNSLGGGGMLHGSQERRVAGNGSGTPVDRAALARWRHMAQESHHGAGINTSHVPTSFLSRCQPFHSS